MSITSVLLLTLALDNPKITATLSDAPGPKVLCEGTAEMPDGVVLNVEIFYDKQPEKLDYQQVLVKGGVFTASFALYKRRERNLPGDYKVRVHYHNAFQRKPLENVDNYFVEAAARIGTKDEIEAAHKDARERLSGQLKGFKLVADDIAAAFDAANGKPDPKDWTKRVGGWKKAVSDLEDAVGLDPDYKALGYGRVTLSSIEYLREKVRALVEFGGAGRAADLRTGREQLDGMIRSILLEIAPAGSSTAERTQLIGQARAALTQAMDAEGPEFAAAKRAFTESVFRLNLKAGGLAQEILRQIAEDGVVFFDTADAERNKAKPLIPPLDKKLQDALRELTKTE